MIKDFLTKNIELKIGSLIIAISLWVFVILSGRSNMTLDIPLKITNLPKGLVVVDSPETVRVNIEGSKNLLRTLETGDISATIDLSNAEPGRMFFNLSRSNISIPKTIVVRNIEPETVSVMVEREMRKKVKVSPSITGLPAKGYIIDAVRVDPDSIIIEGPMSLISEINSVRTELLDINGINTDIQYRAGIDIDDSRIGRNINKVTVHISVKRIKTP